MERRTRRVWLAVGAVALAASLASGGARAQLGMFGPAAPPSGGAALVNGAMGGNAATSGVVSPYGGTPYAGMAMNPLMNPYINPYMNPAATQTGQPMTAGTAAMYFMAAQQMSGGIGSGRLGGPQAQGANPGPVRGAKTQGALRGPAAAKTTEKEPTGGANSPGGTARRYFDRNYPTNPSNPRYYSRQERHFPSPGK
jgi:hypothetical protein